MLLENDNFLAFKNIELLLLRNESVSYSNYKFVC